jgi:hypothetical protein
MTRLRLLAWLITLAALIAPPGLTLHALAAPAGEAVAVDCPDHAPPPDPCPAEGTARHAAATCCPMMAGALAVLSPPLVADAIAPSAAPSAPPARSLTGRVLATDPPPPRR